MREIQNRDTGKQIIGVNNMDNRLNSRSLECDLMDRLREYLSDTDILNEVMHYFNSDRSCQVLENIARDYDIDVTDLDDPELDRE